jgi:hypothetical protein
MPYQIRKIRNKPLYTVKNTETGVFHSKGTTLTNAKKQIALLRGLEKKTIKPRAKGQGLREDAMRVIVDNLFLNDELFYLQGTDFTDRMNILRQQFAEANYPDELIDEIIQQIMDRMNSPKPSPPQTPPRPKKKPRGGGASASITTRVNDFLDLLEEARFN